MHRPGSRGRILPLLAAFSLLVALPYSPQAGDKPKKELNASEKLVLEKLSQSAGSDSGEILDSNDSFAKKIAALVKSTEAKDKSWALENIKILERTLRKKNNKRQLSREAIDALGKAYLELGISEMDQAKGESNAEKRKTMLANSRKSLKAAFRLTNNNEIKGLLKSNYMLSARDTSGAPPPPDKEVVSQEPAWSKGLSKRQRARLEQAFADCAQSDTCRKAVTDFVNKAEALYKSAQKARREFGALLGKKAKFNDRGHNDGQATFVVKNKETGKWDFNMQHDLLNDPHIAPHLAQMVAYAQARKDGDGSFFNEKTARLKGIMASIYTHHEMTKAKIVKTGKVPSKYTQALNYLTLIWDGAFNPGMVNEDTYGVAPSQTSFNESTSRSNNDAPTAISIYTAKINPKYKNIKLDEKDARGMKNLKDFDDAYSK